MQFSRFKRSDSVARDVRILRSQHHGSSYSLKAEQCSIGGLISSMPSLSKRSFVETNFALRRLGLNEIRTSLMTDPRSESRANDAEKHRAVSSQPTLTINGGSTPEATASSVVDLSEYVVASNAPMHFSLYHSSLLTHSCATAHFVRSRLERLYDKRISQCAHQQHVLLRKEVIQPHLPIRLPCYDFVPLT